MKNKIALLLLLHNNTPILTYPIWLSYWEWLSILDSWIVSGSRWRSITSVCR